MSAEFVNKFEEDYYEFMVFKSIWKTFLIFSSLLPGVIPHHNIVGDVTIRRRVFVHGIPTQPEMAQILYPFK